MLDAKLLEQIVKASVTWNKQEVTFNKSFLELLDHYELEMEEDKRTVTLRTFIKECKDD